ncbi:MAG: DUF1801 domain-containing protein [Planctomycetota bacterium]
MAELKTKKTNASVAAYVAAMPDAERRAECKALLALFGKATKAKPRLWGTSIVGFGDLRYRYASGREGDWFAAGFASRKQGLTLYLMCDVSAHKATLKKLGPHKTGVGCLYIKRLADIDLKVLQAMIDDAAKRAKLASQR